VGSSPADTIGLADYIAILQMASSIAAKNFVTRAAMVGAARAMAFTKRLAGRRT
jgi:hypothetical protein